MEKEVWKDVKGYEGIYQISNLGRVKSLDRISLNKKHYKSRLRKTANDTHGYEYVPLCNGKGEKNKSIHRLVAIAFIPNPENKPHINHIDNNPKNNNINNLEWVTHRENMSHKRLLNKTTSKYIGVYKGKNDKKWKAFICLGGKQKYIGSFNTELEASIAYKNALEENNIKNKYL